MKNHFLRFFILANVLLSAAGCSTVDIKTEYDRQMDFSRYKTYAWLPEIGDQKAPSEEYVEEMNAWAKEAIDRNLVSKGFVPVPREEADFLVSFRSKVEETVGTQTYDEYGYDSPLYRYRDLRNHPLPGPYDYPRYRTYEVRYKEWALTVDMMDRINTQLIWHGVATQLLEDDKAEAIHRQIEQAVLTLLEKFPPTAQPK